LLLTFGSVAQGLLLFNAMDRRLLPLISTSLGDSSEDPGPSREGVSPVLCSDTTLKDSEAEHTGK